MKTRIALLISFFVMSLVLNSCVTVNVNFPEGAVQKATDDYVKDLYKSKEESEKKEEVKTGASLINLLVAQSEAQSFQFRMDSPKAKEIQGRQASRIGNIDKYKKEGVVGEVDNGLLEIYAIDALKPLEKKMVQDLVKAENNDRDELYDEVVRYNNLSKDLVGQLKKSLFNSFKTVSPSGTWLKIDGKWEKKP